MRTSTARTVNLLVLLVVLTAGNATVAGCGSRQPGGSSHVNPTPETEARARRVADAWDGSKAAEVWRKGYYPMSDVVELPEHAFRNEADKIAYLSQNLTLDGELPTASAKDGQVEWESGESLTLPLMDARQAYETLARGGSDGPPLTVTGAKLGVMTLATSRGPATVPAWLFALEGYDTPLKRVAVRPSKLPAPPVKPVDDLPSDELWPLGGLVRTAGDGRSVTVVAHHGACDDGPAVDVLETAGSVVLSAYVVGTSDGPCTSQLLGDEVVVKLASPLGERIVLDAFTGRPVPYGAGTDGATGRG
ncbi:hypothetical protein [Streptomyces sp. NPDC001070]